MSKKELVLVLGCLWTKKIQYTLTRFNQYQIVFAKAVKVGMKQTTFGLNENDIYLICELMVRSQMLLKRPIAVIEDSPDIESIFVWKRIARDNDYLVKAVIFDAPLELCFPDSETKTKDIKTLGEFSDFSKRFEQLKQILSMEHQTVLDHVEIIHPKLEDKKDEIL